MIRPAVLVGVLAALPTVSSAQGVEFDGAVTLGYNFNSTSVAGIDVDLNGYSIDAEGDLRFSEQFSVGLGFGLSSGDVEISGLGADINVDLMTLTVEPQYTFSNGAYVGAYYHVNDIDLGLLGPITVGIDADSYGIFGGYDFGQGHVEAFYGTTELESPFGLGIDLIDYGVSGSYSINPQLDIYAAVLRTDIDLGGADLPVTSFSIGADYAINEEFAIYGAVGRTILDASDLGAPDDFHATGLTLGASYDLTSAASLPLVISAEYSRTMFDDNGVLGGVEADIDRFALGLTIPIGNGSSSALNSNTRTARGDYRSALSAVLQSF